MAFSTSSDSWRWRATLNLPVNGIGARSAWTSMAWLMRPGSLRDSALKMVSMSAVEMPGVNASTSAS